MGKKAGSGEISINDAWGQGRQAGARGGDGSSIG